MSIARSNDYYDQYQPSGEYPLPHLLGSLPILAAIATVLGCVLGSFRTGGGWWAIIPPIVAGWLFGWIALRMLQFVHLRNPAVAAGIGIGFGAYLYLVGFYYQMVFADPGYWYRLDELPRFLIHEVNSWIFDSGKKATPNPFTNWIVFCVELCCAASSAAFPLWRGAQRAYCERCQKWATDAELRLPMPSALSIKQALIGGKLSELTEQRTLLGDPGQQPHLTLRLEGCFHDDDPKSPCAWVTITANHVDNGFTRDANELTQVAITQDVLRQLAEKIPALLPGVAAAKK